MACFLYTLHELPWESLGVLKCERTAPEVTSPRVIPSGSGHSLMTAVVWARGARGAYTWRWAAHRSSCRRWWSPAVRTVCRLAAGPATHPTAPSAHADPA